MNIRERILAKAPNGVRLCEIQGSPHLVKQEFDRLVSEKLLIRRTLLDRNRPIYFDSVVAAKRYFTDAQGLKPLSTVREIPINPTVQQIPSFPYIVLDPSNVPTGYYQSV